MGNDSGWRLYIDSGVLLSSATLKRHYEAHIKSHYPTVIIGYVFGFGIEHHNGAEIIEQLNSCSE